MHLTAAAAAELGPRAGTPVVIGAGDRACEVLGCGATGARPMVSWGTTANVSFPRPHRPEPGTARTVGHPGDRRRVAGGGRPVGGGLAPRRGSRRCAGAPRRIGGPRRHLPAGSPRGDGRAVARRGPGPLVAAGRRRRTGGTRRFARTRRTGPRRVRGGGPGRRPVPGPGGGGPGGVPGHRAPPDRVGGGGAGVAGGARRGDRVHRRAGAGRARPPRPAPCCWPPVGRRARLVAGRHRPSGGVPGGGPGPGGRLRGAAAGRRHRGSGAARLAGGRGGCVAA